MMLRTGEYVEAKDLKPGDSTMPLYRKISDKKAGDNISGYEMTYDPATNKYEYTHRLVGKALGLHTILNGTIIHHKDFNKLNNAPENLMEMRKQEHTQLHCEAGHFGGKKVAELRKIDKDLDERIKAGCRKSIIRYNKSYEKRKRTTELNRLYDTAKHIRAYNASEQHEADNEIRRARKIAMWKDHERRKKAQERMKIKFPDDFLTEFKQLVVDNPTMSLGNLAKLITESDLILSLREANPGRKLKRAHRDMLTWALRSDGWKDFADFRKSLGLCLKNHKVVSVEFLTETEDTYCITIDITHNFATSCGVIIKNSFDEDFFLAVRDGKQLAKVDVLAGPNYQSTEEVEYFQRKLHGVLKVPRSYLGQDGPVAGKAILSNEDVRAARVTLGIQRELRNGIARIIRIDQAARGIDPWKHEFDVHMTVPSGIYELAQMEVRNARADFAQRFMPFVSMQWVRKHVFKLSEDEIKEIDKQVDKEQQKQLDLQLKGMKGQMDLQTQAQQQAMLGAGGAPGGLQQGGGMVPQEQPQMPQPMMPMASDLPRTQLDWKRYDTQRYLEERREKETDKRLSELEDNFNALLQRDKLFAAKVRQSQMFMDEVKEAGIMNHNGYISSIPSGKPRNL